MQQLNAPTSAERLAALAELAPSLTVDHESLYVNNHIHTIFSFSPYSPCMALYKALDAGLSTAGIMDHDSVGGAREFIRAGEIANMATTVGLEMRVSLAGTPYADMRVNNPDQTGNCYVAIHGLPHQSIDQIETFLKPRRAAREDRNRAMTDKLNEILAAAGVSLDYDSDVRPLSQAAEGGSVTERHLCYATALKLIDRYGDALVDGLCADLGMNLNDKQRAMLADTQNPIRAYDLLNVLKSEFVQRFYIPGTDECPLIAEYIRAAHEAGAIAAYPYLGDVGDSVTGDKKTQTFEDAFLDELFVFLKEIGFDAITYMPTRNTKAQLDRIKTLCAQHGFFEISGEDINSPRQSFICPQLAEPDFAHLREATWALIGHEKAATANLKDGMFTAQTIAAMPTLAERIAHFAKIGRG